ncbi:MAG: T9SS type A sorting domain-containing protein, partial [Bacteroidota bacterium]
IAWNQAVNGPASIRVMTLQGQVVIEQEAASLATPVALELPRMAPGVYVIDVATTQGRAQQRLIVR